MKSEYPNELEEVRQIVQRVDSQSCKTKRSREKTKRNQVLYSPSCLNKAFRKEFTKCQWQSHRISCDYPTQYYVPGYIPSRTSKQAFREIDFVKNQAGVEVQFGKYAFMVYNVCAKMTIFHHESVIEVGIEIVPVKEFALQMSTGVSYFEQFVWDLEHCGVSNIDIPVLILGVADH